MEERILDFLRRGYKRKIGISRLMSELNLTRSEKMELLGSIKDFKQLERTYVKRNKRVYSYLQMVS